MMSTKLVYSVLLLYYAYHRSETPAWAKRIILGSIAYFLAPIDSVPDLTPFIGFTDDMGVLTFGLVTIACYIDDEVRSAARAKLPHFISEIDAEDLHEVDRFL